MTDLPEDEAERIQFDRATQRLYDGNPLRHVAAILTQSSKAQPAAGSLSKMLAICANEVAREDNDRHRLMMTIRRVFPHFSGMEEVTLEPMLSMVTAIGREYTDMVLNWTKAVEEITFFDQDGKERKIVYSAGEADVGVPAGWGIPEEADWEVRSAEPRSMPPLDDGLRQILGQPNFMVCPLAEYFRQDGHDIPHKSEAEQAFILHMMLGFYLKSPKTWRLDWGNELTALADRIREKQKS